MRRFLTIVTVIIAVVLVFSACSKKKSDKRVVSVESPVIMEQVNTESNYVARAYLESLFLGDEEMFDKCYPEGFVKLLGEANDVDVFEVYKKAVNINGDIIGTANAGSTEYTMENGFDQAGMKSRIAHVTGLEYSDIEQIRLQKVRACFTNGVELAESEFSFIVYKTNGSWYMLESVIDIPGN
ncbi:MAG: hypothetical protein IKG30_11325 [Clostridiales bacterium]|nr:hypothetical protein [Clostridiales bacterium]